MYDMRMNLSNDIGLRERKKQATRLAISDVATRLFIERGFDNVTIAEIAVAANVAKMTVSNYFPRKEDLFFDRDEESRAFVREALRQRTTGQSPVDALRTLTIDLSKQKHPFAQISAGTARFWKTVAESPALCARAREMRDAFETDLAKSLAEAVGKSHADPEAHLAAALLVATWITAYSAALREHQADAASDMVSRTFTALIESGFSGVTAALAGTLYV